MSTCAHGCRLAFLLAAFLLPAPLALAQPVQGDIKSVGFLGEGQERFKIRSGRWTPILLTLNSAADQHFQGEARVESPDLDGDRVAYRRSPVTVTAREAGKKVWCYGVILKESQTPLQVELLDDTGQLITTIEPPGGFEIISNDTKIILDVSPRAVAGFQRLDSGSKNYNNTSLGGRKYYRNICVARLPCEDLPDRWIGLEAADVVVWDEPDPESVSDAQLRALIDWVRQGGRLVVGIGPAWAKIERSLLAEIMPFAGPGPTVEADRLEMFSKYFSASAERLSSALAFTSAAPAPDARVTFRDRLPNNKDIALIASRFAGSGRVIASAARLSDLFGDGAAVKSELWDEFLDLPQHHPGFRPSETFDLLTAQAPLLPAITERIDFRQAASVLVIGVAAFILLYGITATLGSWAWLKQRNLTHLSWTIFAGFALAASFISVAAVSLMRGWGGKVHTFSFVDLVAGEHEAREAAYFGYRSTSRDHVTLSLPGQRSMLRGLSSGADADTTYATPERYIAETTAQEGKLEHVPTRATLKQFEGRWVGTLDGTILSDLVADRQSGRILPESWIANDLGYALAGGVVLYIDPRLRGRDGGTPSRIAGVMRRTDREKYWDSEFVPPAVNVLAVDIPAMKAGEKVSKLNAAQYARLDADIAAWQGRVPAEPVREPMAPTLWSLQCDEWTRPFRPLLQLTARFDAATSAALLASTCALYVPNPPGSDFTLMDAALDRSGLMDVDVTHWLAGGQEDGCAVLLLLSDAPGPARLHGGDHTISTPQARTILRVRAPIRYVGRPPEGSGS